MGLVTAESDSHSGDKRFSSDVLKIEIVGPKQPHLSVVDVPGEHLSNLILIEQY